MKTDTTMRKAVALSYPEGAEAPFIIAKGKNYAAEKILHIAEAHHIKVVEDTETVHILSAYDIGSAIPPETYQAVASIFAFLKKIKEP